MMIKLLAGKAELIKRHWSAPTQRLGLMLLSLWPWTRAVALELNRGGASDMPPLVANNFLRAARLPIFSSCRARIFLVMSDRRDCHVTRRTTIMLRLNFSVVDNEKVSVVHFGSPWRRCASSVSARG